MSKKAIILINVGTPDNADVKSVRKYLKEFLNDKRVMTIPWILRKILVNLIIVPFRAGKSTKLYKMIWSDKGSPLLYYTNNLRDKLQQFYKDEYKVITAMRYGNPSLTELISKLNDQMYSELIFVPLYPQYASSTTGSVVDLIFQELKKWTIIPKTKIIDQFYNDKEFISTFSNNIRKYNFKSFDHIIFSFHGLPLKHIEDSHPTINHTNCTCDKSFPAHGEYCYKATCYETARLIANQLEIPESFYSVSFQSRLTKDWLSPFTDQVLIELAKKGNREILIVSPAFVSDCLETLVELEIEYNHLFMQNGGTKLSLVKSLNDSDEWVNALIKIIQKN